MTDVDTAPVAAGWYPDPQGAGATRFWDGAAWTEHVKGAPARVAQTGGRPAAPAPASPRFAPPSGAPARPVAPPPGTPYSTVLPRIAQRRNGMASAGLTFGILSLVANVLLVPTILGIVLGAIGVARAPHRGGVGQARGIVGIVLGAVGVLAAGVQLAILIPVVIGFQHGAAVSAIRASVTETAASHGVTIASVQCSPTATLARAGSFECLATRTSGGRDVIDVSVTSGGGWTWSSRTLG